MGAVAVQERMRLVAGELSCLGIGTWCFGRKGNLFYSTCTQEKELLPLLQVGVLDRIVREVPEQKGPKLLSDALGLLWCAENVPIQEGGALLIVFGPVCYSEVTLRSLEERLREMEVSIEIKSPLFRVFRQIPVLSTGEIQRLAAMFHFMMTEERTGGETVWDHAGQALPEKQLAQEEPEELAEDRNAYAEEMILGTIREGTPDYRRIISESGVLGNDLISKSGNPLRDAKNSLIVFSTLCAKAAVEGGVPASRARDLRCSYISGFETCRTINELVQAGDAMLADLVERVREIHREPGKSEAVLQCCDYIRSHLRQPLSAEEIGKQLGYAGYYLTRKFTKETGMRMTDYINQARIEEAKIELLTTRKPIQEISDEFQFGTRNYFGKIFREQTGMTPAAYRERGRVKGQQPTAEK